jgi:hypothetical protein
MGRRGDSDVLIDRGGTVYLVIPITAPGFALVKNRLPEDGPHLGRNVVVEHRFIADIVRGMLNDGLAVGRC